MFDVWVGDVEITGIVLIAAVCMIPLQCLLCAKVRSRLLRLAPTGLLLLAVIVLSSIWLSGGSGNWDFLGYMILALFAAILLAADGVGWLIWGIVCAVKKKSGNF